MPAPEEIRHRENVIFFPVEALAADIGETFAFHHHDESRAGLALQLQFFARAKQLRRVIERRENRAAGHRVDELHLDAFERITFFPAQPLQGVADFDTLVMEHWCRLMSPTALV